MFVPGCMKCWMYLIVLWKKSLSEQSRGLREIDMLHSALTFALIRIVLCTIAIYITSEDKQYSSNSSPTLLLCKLPLIIH